MNITIAIAETTKTTVVCRIVPSSGAGRTQPISWADLRAAANSSPLYASILGDARIHARTSDLCRRELHTPTEWNGMWSGPRSSAPSPVGPTEAVWFDPDGALA